MERLGQLKIVWNGNANDWEATGRAGWPATGIQAMVAQAMENEEK
jgi:hypothetical protein